MRSLLYLYSALALLAGAQAGSQRPHAPICRPVSGTSSTATSSTSLISTRSTTTTTTTKTVYPTSTAITTVTTNPSTTSTTPATTTNRTTTSTTTASTSTTTTTITTTTTTQTNSITTATGTTEPSTATTTTSRASAATCGVRASVKPNAYPFATSILPSTTACRLYCNGIPNQTLRVFSIAVTDGRCICYSTSFADTVQLDPVNGFADFYDVSCPDVVTTTTTTTTSTTTTTQTTSITTATSTTESTITTGTTTTTSTASTTTCGVRATVKSSARAYAVENFPITPTVEECRSYCNGVNTQTLRVFSIGALIGRCTCYSSSFVDTVQPDSTSDVGYFYDVSCPDGVVTTTTTSTAPPTTTTTMTTTTTTTTTTTSAAATTTTPAAVVEYRLQGTCPGICSWSYDQFLESPFSASIDGSSAQQYCRDMCTSIAACDFVFVQLNHVGLATQKWNCYFHYVPYRYTSSDLLLNDDPVTYGAATWYTNNRQPT